MTMTSLASNLSPSRDLPARKLVEDRPGLPSLLDLLSPIDKTAFYREHWCTGRPFLSQPNPALIRKVTALEPLASVDALLAHYARDVAVFGPGPSRRMVPASAAREALDAGLNVYFPRVSEAVAHVRDLFKEVVFELGLAPQLVNIEAFAGSAGGVSSRHFDHEINFQILLDGEKEWELEANANLENPLFPFHPTRNDDGDWVGFAEEGYASDPAMPTAFDSARSHRVRATAGSVLYLPRGLWHEARSITATWGINLAFKGTTWAESLTKALAARLQEDPRFRAYCDGYRGRTLSEEHARERERTFAILKDEAAAALSNLSLSDSDLAPMGEHRCSWAPEAKSREVVRRGESSLLMAPPVLEQPIVLSEASASIARALCAFRHPFQLKHAWAVMPDRSPETIYNLIALLAQKNLVRVRSPHESA